MKIAAASLVVLLLATLAGCGSPPPAPAATAATAAATPTVDPQFTAATKDFLDAAEILVERSGYDFDAAFKERVERVAEAMIRLPKLEVEPAKSIRRACAEIDVTCGMLKNQMEITHLTKDPKEYEVELEECSAIKSDIRADVALVRDALTAGQAVTLPESNADRQQKPAAAAP